MKFRLQWSRRRMFWTIALTALATVFVVVIEMNFATPEK